MILAFLVLISASLGDVISHAIVQHGHGHEGYRHEIEHPRIKKAIPKFGYTLQKLPTKLPTTLYRPTTTTEKPTPEPTTKPTPAPTPAPKPTPPYTPPPTKPAPSYKPTPVYPVDLSPAPSYKQASYKPIIKYKPTPVYKPTPSYHKPVYKEPSYHDTPVKYDFEWRVVDDYAKLNYGQIEGRDGYATTGEYRVLLPDCRTQVVKYNTVDGYSGNVAEVVYEGAPCTYAPKPIPAYHV